MNALELNAICKSFGPQCALDNITLSVPTGSRTVIVGPSGSGKTTLLRMIAGFEFPDSGSLSLNGQVLVDSTREVPALARNRRRPARRLPRLWLAALLFGLVLAVVLFVLLRPGRKDAPVPPMAPAAPAQQIHIRPLVAAGPPEPTPPPAARPAEGDAPAPAGSLRLGELQVRPSGRD